MNYNRIFAGLLVAVLTISTAGIALAQTHLILGDEDEEYDAMILQPQQIEEGPDGNLYVLDGGDSCIKVYSSAGDYLRKLAGPGEGPGEFQRTDGATFGFTTDDKLFFTEYFGGHRWLTIMELNGDLIQTLTPQLQVNFGIKRAVSLDNGGFLVQIAYASTAYSKNSYYLYKRRQSLVHLDSNGAIVKEIVHTEHPAMISYSPNGGTSNLPFAPAFTWAMRQNNTVIWSDGLDSNLSIIGLNGQPEQHFDTKLPPPQKVTGSDLKNWRRNRKELLVSHDASWWNQFGRVIEDYDKSLFDKPILRRISDVPEDHLLITGPWDYENSHLTYWLYDNEGAIISSLTAKVWSLHVSTNFVLFFLENEDGSTSVNAVKWSGNVGETLNFLKNGTAISN